VNDLGMTAQKLRLLADWIDLVDDAIGEASGITRGTEVQEDLRHWADGLEVTHAVVPVDDLTTVLREVEARKLSRAATAALDRLGDQCVAVRQRRELIGHDHVKRRRAIEERNKHDHG